MMTVENAETPRRKNQQRGAGKEDPHQRDGQLSSFFFKTCGDQRDDVRSGEYAD